MGDSLEHLGTWDCYTRLLLCLHCTPPHPSQPTANHLPESPSGPCDDYVGALPCLHCGGEKGKLCTYFETLCLCHMSSARSTSDGRGPVTRKGFRTGRSQGNLARTPDVAVVTPLNNFLGPEGDTVTADKQLPKYQSTPAGCALGSVGNPFDRVCPQPLLVTYNSLA